MATRRVTHAGTVLLLVLILLSTAWVCALFAQQGPSVRADQASIASTAGAGVVLDPSRQGPSGVGIAALAPARRDTGRAGKPSASQRGKSFWSVGGDASVWWSKPTGSLAGPNPQTLTTIQIPTAQYLVDINPAPRLSIDFPLSLRYLKQNGTSLKSFQLGIQPHYYFTGESRRDVRFFAGPDFRYRFVELKSTQTQDARQFALGGAIGVDVPIYHYSRFRVAVQYDHYFQYTHDNLPAENQYGFYLGPIFDFPCDDDDEDDAEGPSLFDLRFGSSLTLSHFGNFGGTSVPNETLFQLPSPYVGGYVRLGETRQFAVGGEISFNRVSESGTSATNFRWEPGVEYYILPGYLKKWDFRVRGFGALNYLRETTVSGGTTQKQDGWIIGYGGEAAVTHPFSADHVLSLGFNYTHYNEKQSLFAPSQNDLKFKVGFDFRW